MMRARLCSAVVAGCLVSAVSFIAPSSATDDRIQTLSKVGSGHPFTGIADDGTATAVWTERAKLYYAVRPPGGEFGFVRAVPGVDLALDVWFAEDGNGNAIIAWVDADTAGRVKAAVRIGNRSTFGRPQVLQPGDEPGTAFSIDAAISASGRAVVTWAVGGNATPAVRAAVSNGAGTFGDATTLMTGPAASPEAGIAGDGSALVVWDVDTQSVDEIRGAAAPAGGGFGSDFLIEALDQGPGEPELDVNASGAAILAYDDAVAEDECPSTGCSPFRLEARYGSVSGQFAASRNITEITPGHTSNAHEVAIDDSGAAAVVFSGVVPESDYRFMAKVSTAGGTFPSGPPQTISEADAVSGPGISNDDFEVAAGAGGFTAVWINDHNGDGEENEVYRSNAAGAGFGPPHQLSPTDPDDSADNAFVARNANGDNVAAWLLFTDDLLAHVTPTLADTVDPSVGGVRVTPSPYNPRRGPLTVKFTPSEDVRATVTIHSPSGPKIATLKSRKILERGRPATRTWNGRTSGSYAPPGTYGYAISVTDAAGNSSVRRGTFKIKR